MLPRTLEPEVMDTQEESIAYDDMDHQAVNELFVEDLLAIIATTGKSASGEVLDIGTGTARIPILLCERTTDLAEDEELRVIAVDLSVHMLDLARLNIEIANLTDRILLDRIDAKTLALEDGRFDLVISNSIIHHTPNPNLVFQEGCSSLQTRRPVLFSGSLTTGIGRTTEGTFRDLHKQRNRVCAKDVRRFTSCSADVG